MNADELFEVLPERPELLLAVGLSAPYSGGTEQAPQGFSVDFTSADVYIRISRRVVAMAAPTFMLCTKEAICLAILLHALWRERGGPQYEQILANTLLNFSLRLGQSAAQPSTRKSLLHPLLYGDNEPIYSSLRSELQIGGEFIEKVDTRCWDTFETLERENLAVDPGFLLSPELVVLFGLIPMQWSVRTAQGDSVYRRIKINAPFWSLSIDKTSRGDQLKNDWHFEIRGINYVRSLLRTAAEQYLYGEDAARRSSHRPRLRTPQRLHLDRDAEE